MIDFQSFLEYFIPAVSLAGSIYFGILLIKHRFKYYLIIVIFLTIPLVISILDSFIPGNYFFTRVIDSIGIGHSIQLVLIILWWIMFMLFIFYWDIKRLIFSNQMKPEPDPEKEERKCLKLLKKNPNNALYLYRYAEFLNHVRKDYDQAELYYQKTLTANPKPIRMSTVQAVYAQLLSDVRKDYDQAESLFKKSLDADPDNSYSLGAYAFFLWQIRKDYDKAEDYFKKAIEAEPTNAKITKSYAGFLMYARKDYDRADEYFLKAVNAQSKDDNIVYSYAYFLNKFRKDYDKAEKYFLKLISIQPSEAKYLYAYGTFLTDIRKDYDRAEKLYKKAIGIKPENSEAFSAYGWFLMDARNDYDRAEEFYKKAIQFEPDNARNLGAYAFFLLEKRRNYDQAIEYLQKALELEPKEPGYLCNYARALIVQGDPDQAKETILLAFKYNQEHNDLELELELCFYCFAIFPRDFPDSESKIESLLAQGITASGYFKDVLEVARKRSHPQYEKLCQLEARMQETPA